MASIALQEAIIAALDVVVELTGVHDGAPPRADYPYAVLDAFTEIDWSHKTGNGREVPVALTLWDDQPERLSRLSARAEQAVVAISSIAGWQLVSMRFVRRRSIRDVAGPWAAALDFRARLLLI